MVLLKESKVNQFPLFNQCMHAERRIIFKREYQISGRVDYAANYSNILPKLKIVFMKPNTPHI